VEHNNLSVLCKNPKTALNIFTSLNPGFYTQSSEGKPIFNSFVQCIMNTQKTNWRHFLYFCFYPTLIHSSKYEYRLLYPQDEDLLFPIFKNIYSYINELLLNKYHPKGLIFNDEEPFSENFFVHPPFTFVEKKIENEDDYISSFFIK
jgi:hypothetical protein